jgi:hypothetical protein
MFRFPFFLLVTFLTLAVRCQASTVTLSGSIIRKVESPSSTRNKYPFRTTILGGRSRRSKIYPTTVTDHDEAHFLDMDDPMKVELCSVRLRSRRRFGFSKCVVLSLSSSRTFSSVYTSTLIKNSPYNRPAVWPKM